MRSDVSSSTASTWSAFTISLGLTTISRTTPSIGEVIGIGRSGVISAGASALSRTGISAASATTARGDAERAPGDAASSASA